MGNMVSQPVAWLGLLGVFLVTGELLWRRTTAPQALAYLTLLFWVVLLFAGSRTPLTGFPQRFGRDLRAARRVRGLALVLVLRSLSDTRAGGCGLRRLSGSGHGGYARGCEDGRQPPDRQRPSIQMTITPEISAAGEWLREHNQGGNIMVSPHANQVPSRMMLAMGGYSALQSFERWQLESPRDLPPTGPKPLEDVMWVMNHPAGERTEGLLEKHQVRYVVLYKEMPDRLTRDYWKAFAARPDSTAPSSRTRTYLSSLVARRRLRVEVAAVRAASLLKSMGDEKDRNGLLFVLLVYAASRLFYLGAGALFASVAGGAFPAHNRRRAVRRDEPLVALGRGALRGAGGWRLPAATDNVSPAFFPCTCCL